MTLEIFCYFLTKEKIKTYFLCKFHCIVIQHTRTHQLYLKIFTRFQVNDLRYASPATVSRCGMVYVDPKNLGYRPYWSKWVNARVNKEEQTHLFAMHDKYVTLLIDMVLEGIVDGKEEKQLKTIVPQTNLNMVSKGYYLFVL